MNILFGAAWAATKIIGGITVAGAVLVVAAMAVSLAVAWATGWPAGPSILVGTILFLWIAAFVMKAIVDWSERPRC